MPDTATEDPRRRTADPTVMAPTVYTTVTAPLSARISLMPDESWDYDT
jgi:hypothetical protein